jgi:hypothetical protein
MNTSDATTLSGWPAPKEIDDELSVASRFAKGGKINENEK